jgi:hypothetical protein
MSHLRTGIHSGEYWTEAFLSWLYVGIEQKYACIYVGRRVKSPRKNARVFLPLIHHQLKSKPRTDPCILCHQREKQTNLNKLPYFACFLLFPRFPFFLPLCQMVPRKPIEYIMYQAMYIYIYIATLQ